MKRCFLVTGGCGFIGTPLAQQLTEQGKVRVVDLKPPAIQQPGIEYVQGDILEEKLLEKCLLGVDTVYHLAAQANVSLCEELPEQSWRQNVLATQRVLQSIATKPEVTRFIFTSSAAVYGSDGEKNHQPIAETQSLLPLSQYGRQKLECEKQIQKLSELRPELAVFSLRLFNVYGPSEDPLLQSVIPRFIRNLRSHQPLQIFGDGRQTRDFIYIEDVVRALIFAAEAPKEYGPSYNIGTATATEVGALAELMLKWSNVKTRRLSQAKRNSDISYSVANITRAKKELGWQPQVSLKQGLALTCPELFKPKH